MSFTYTLLVLVCVSALAVGQLLFKMTAISQESTESTTTLLLSLAVNPLFLLALFIYGSAAVLWVWILRHVPLTVAYPFFALSFAVVPLLSSIFLGEQVDLGYWIGIGLIVAGITISTL